MFVNKVLRKIYGSNRKEVKEAWKKFHNEDFIIYILHGFMTFRIGPDGVLW
jgi:hypothetical protein